MAQGKIEPLIAAAEQRAKAQSEAEIHALINAIDEQINETEKQLELKFEEIRQVDRGLADRLANAVERIVKLEAGVSAPSSD